jgi:hypothetical protein
VGRRPATLGSTVRLTLRSSAKAAASRQRFPRATAV